MKTHQKIKWVCIWIGIVCIVFASGIGFAKSISDSQGHGKPPMPKVVAHTSGDISSRSLIMVRFNRPMISQDLTNSPLASSPFQFQPEIQGTAMWKTPDTLTFQPATALPPGQQFSASVKLDAMAKPFTFTFSVIRQALDISMDGLQIVSAKSPDKLELTGEITTADVAEPAKVIQVVSAVHNGKSLNIRWTHAKDQRHHRFTIAGIKRGQEPSTVTVKWDGQALGVAQTGQKVLEVPVAGQFKVLDVRPVHGKTQYIEIRFSHPLKENQDLKGLIRVKDTSAIRFSTQGNTVRVYGPGRWHEDLQLTVETGIRNSVGQRLASKAEYTVSFAEMKPAVKFSGKGVIIPTTAGLTIPIETVNLRAIIVEAVNVFENNVAQFFQQNPMDGSEEIRRVGRMVWKKVIPLDFSPEKKNKWMRTGLDLTPLVKKYPGGFYRLSLSFDARHVVYTCKSPLPKWDPKEDEAISPEAWEDETQSSWWDDWEASQGVPYWDMYSHRNDPCHPGYYKEYHDHSPKVSKNIIISDIGLIAKKGNDGSLLVVATDIRTAQPLADTFIWLLDYQQQEIEVGKTDENGIAMFRPNRKPFLIIAKPNLETDQNVGYLRLDDGSALSVSHFDVAGQAVKKGLKGFIYGERGVWRPGDTMYLTFILLDPDHRLPENHPVLFELRDPKNRLVKRLKNTQSVDGFYSFHIATEPDAPTGKWMAKVRVGGTVFEKPIRVETVMPNRLKINLDFGKQTKFLKPGQFSANLSSTWLHGAVAKGLKTDVKLTLVPTTTRFPKYEEYVFDDPVRQYNTRSWSLFSGNLNNKGQVIIKGALKPQDQAPGMLSAVFKTRVFEPGGAFSTHQMAIPFHPFDQYVGIRLPKGDKARGMLLTDTQHTVRIALLDSAGNPVPKGKVRIKLYKIKWRWWWEKGEESLASYVGTNAYNALKTDTVDIQDGQGQWKFEINYPEWGRYLIRVEDLKGHHFSGKIVYIDWPGWAGRGQKDIPGGATVLSFSADKESYEVGQPVTLTIPTGKNGRGLISIENGSRVLHTDWIKGGDEPVRYQFIATADMAPNVYAHVTFLQPHLQAGNDLPIRMYGIIPIKIEDPSTRLQPQIEVPDEFRPEETGQIKVREAKGRPMTYTVAVVDEGLLDLTGFATPDPWNHFYKREALGVRTWDVYDMVAGAFGGKLEQLLAIGGSDEAAKKGRKKAHRFPPMVRFLGPFHLDAGAEDVHQIQIPQYVGSVRVMVVAGYQGAFGHADKAVFVRKPLMVLGTLPRVLGPEETVDLPVSVFAMDPSVSQVTVTVTAQGPVEIAGDAVKSIVFSEPGDDLVSFTLKTPDRTGVARVSIQAQSGPETVHHDIELDVRSPSFPVTAISHETVKPSQTWTVTKPPVGMIGTNSAVLEVSRIPPMNLTSRLDWLIQYPHGCVEQVTSSVFPQLYLDGLVELTANDKQAIQKHVKAGILKLQTYQNADGGFGYWPQADQSHDWSSSYAGHFLLEAQKAGFVVATETLNPWKSYQQRNADAWEPGQPNAELIQAYRLYTLALAGEAAMGPMNRLREIDSLPTAARWLLAGAYVMAGHPEAADQLVSSATTQVPQYRELANTFGSNLRDQAMILQILCLMNRTDPATTLAKEIAEQLSSNKRLNTQAVAFSLMAMAQYARANQDDQLMEFRYSWNQNDPVTVSQDAPIAKIPLYPPVSGDPGTLPKTFQLKLENTSSMVIYPRLVLRGTPKPGKETPADNGLNVSVNYTTTSGKKINPARLDQGTDIVAEVQVKNTSTEGEIKEVALIHMIPSGWEIHNPKMDLDQAGTYYQFNYQDIRDDRLYTYFNIQQGETKSFRVLLNASYIGKFYLPMVQAYAMYDETLSGHTQGKWVQVVMPGAN